MKKISIIALTIALTLSLAACGRTSNDMSTHPTIIPDPTIQTNIPDPDVDTKMPMYTDSTDPTNWNGSTQETNTTDNHTRSGF